MKDNRDLEQVLRIDGKNCFLEVMLSGLGFDKVLLNFKQYDANLPSGQRSKGDIGIFMGIYEAELFARDVMSGRIPKMGAKALKVAKDTGKQYADVIYMSQGGTPAKNRPDGIAIARVMELSPGTRQPWVLCAKQGKAHETPEGLIVMNGAPDTTIRVPMVNDKLKTLALAIETVVRVWEQLRFIPVAAPMMKAAQDRRQEVLDKVKAEAAAAAVASLAPA